MSDAGRIRRLVSEYFARGDSTGWFEALYAGAYRNEWGVPWARHETDTALVQWLAQQDDRMTVGKRALVVGCGLGDDAEALAAAGYVVTAFDISATAIGWCGERFPQSRVHYTVADLFALPPDWAGTYDFVLESRTIQSLPWQLCEPAAQAIARCAAPGGRVLVLALAREPHEDRRGIPWPLSRQDLAAFVQAGLVEQRFDETYSDGTRRFKVEYRAPLLSSSGGSGDA